MGAFIDNVGDVAENEAVFNDGIGAVTIAADIATHVPEAVEGTQQFVPPTTAAVATAMNPVSEVGAVGIARSQEIAATAEKARHRSGNATPDAGGGGKYEPAQHPAR